MFSILLAVQILVSISIIVLVMLQHGKGADMGAAFGSGSSGTVFGSRGSGSFFTRATGVLAAVFFINCLLIASPLVRDSTRAADSIADQLEQQVNAEQDSADAAGMALETLEPQLDVPAAPGELTGTLLTEDDVPGGAPAQPGEPVADDLPQ
ncbi:MAG: preprotein translocase subunit SecG [Halobacteria archaeon]|nr:preprotein translocase subunit SecG [Halobacteria archaeon]